VVWLLHHMSNKKKSGARIHSNFSRNHPRSKRWAVDYDYLKKLSPEEMEWLAAFNNRHYGANFSYQPPEGFEEWTHEEKKAAYVNNNVSNADLYTRIPEGHIAQLPASLPSASAYEMTLREEDENAENPYTDAPPVYLDSAEYKQARAELRAHLSPTRKLVAPDNTPELKIAQENLERIVKSHG
jgi:hypothetical protein